MLKYLDAFGFGPTLIRWVETFYNDITSCILNNGICTPYFELQRGVRRDALSPYLFTIAAQILAVTIRSREDIHSIMIGQDEFRLVQYASDLTRFWQVFLFSCNYDVKDCKVISTFYRELLQWWADLRITFSGKPSML